MTRINVGIAPQLLTNKHLIAEHREIKRIPNNVASGKCNFSGIPEKFTLGTGHVKFFYNKLQYLKNRYELLYAECLKRGFNVQYYGDAWIGLPENLMNDYLPTPEDVAIIQQRIDEKLGMLRPIICDICPGDVPMTCTKTIGIMPNKQWRQRWFTCPICGYEKKINGSGYNSEVLVPQKIEKQLNKQNKL